MPLPETLDFALVTRLRDVLREQPVTESELRVLSEQADGWARLVGAQVDASERRLEGLVADPSSSLAEQAEELRRLLRLQPALAEARSLVAELETKARRLRTDWLLHQADAGQERVSSTPKAP